MVRPVSGKIEIFGSDDFNCRFFKVAQRIKQRPTDKALSKNKVLKSVGRFSIRWP
jgi:hypothetical protein